MALLDSIDSPEDLKKLGLPELKALAAEIREKIVAVVGRNGGHLSSNLGVVELTLAIHRVFDSPRDAVVWDVGHQCYAHKLVTGRRDEFESIRRLDGISGFPKRSESPHDAFDTGHASTSISAALGILEARRVLGQGGVAVAVIGDGALTGGMAFEALGHAGQLGLPLVVVLNDNKMSISPNVGALSSYLSRLSATVRYQGIRLRIDRIVKGVPLIGDFLYDRMVRAKRAVKALLFKENLFSDLGLEYAGPIDGHNITAMTNVLREARAIGKPVVVHVVTRKGKGFDLAEEDPSLYHGVAPTRCLDGEAEELSPGVSSPGVSSPLTFTEAFSRAMVRRGCIDERLVAISAAMTTGVGLDAFQVACPGRLHDVGIAEEHAVTFAAGIASAGLRPVVALYSTFVQRAVDQVFHDVALPGLPVVIALDRSGAVGEDGETHQGLYDIAIFRSFPNLAILAPASGAELALCLEWALDSGKPAVIRYPKAACPREEKAYAEALESGRGVFVRRSGAETLLVALGALVAPSVEASDALLRDGSSGGADVYSLRFVAPFDEDFFLDAAAPYARVIVLEEGVARGGFGEYLVSLIATRLPRVAATAVGFPSEPFAQGSRDELLARAGLGSGGIKARVLEAEASDSRRIFVFRAEREGA
ncbi:MAG: 1-deoxy-D-xylulose-5-phosphate synthase [Rectinemataceae bacterium]|jgi:1-deoxy-D-xylulose-5-phosphate synthase